MTARLEASLKDSKAFEGRNLDKGLFVKCQKFLYNSIDMPSELKYLYNDLAKNENRIQV